MSSQSTAHPGIINHHEGPLSCMAPCSSGGHAACSGLDAELHANTMQILHHGSIRTAMWGDYNETQTPQCIEHTPLRYKGGGREAQWVNLDLEDT
ncbi:hypothetical protein NHX12_024041 [Muraenolepis orangiensis]|uniref:Uncharacterized protein n=1 Tax=Muraenolepis orangiensis TaxID=630683 RepID=A0A9Q0IT91_9TELE|nr:hypothetical protein NHX12_024041 [Muraenolepis orangiensis]